jgi:integrase
MVGEGRKRGILTILEAKTLFGEANIAKQWKGNIPLYTINLIGASAGLRIGEIQGLQVKYVRLDDSIPHIEVRQSWHGKHGLGMPKTAGSVRDVPLPALTIKYLRLAIDGKAADDFVFPGDRDHHLHGTQHEQIPIDAKWVNRAFFTAMELAGIENYRERYITFHSHRHYYVSIMRGKLPEHLLRALTGHASIEMTNRYTHTALSDVALAAQIQDAILAVQ